MKKFIAIIAAGVLTAGVALAQDEQDDPIKKVGQDVDAIAQTAGNLIKWVFERPAVIVDFVSAEVEKTKEYQKKQWSGTNDKLKGFFNKFPEGD
mgnify:FL=1